MADLSHLRIAFLAGTLGQGGAEKQLYYLLRALRECGAEAHLLTLTRGEYWEQPIRELGIPLVWVGESPSRPARQRRIIAELKRIRPRLIQSQHFYTNLYAALAGWRLAIPAIGAIRNDVLSEIRNTGAILGRLCLWLPPRLLVNSQAAMRTARQLGIPAKRLHLLRNVIELEPFLRIETPPEHEPLRIVAAGRLVRQKRLDRFLMIVARVMESVSRPCEALIYGQGPLREELERQAADLGLSAPRLQFMGLAGDPQIIHANSDIFVLTSDWEGTPNVVLEAMASGLPVVATRVGDVQELIEHGQSGFCFLPEDEDGMIEALRALIDHRPMRIAMGAKAREAVQSRHSLKYFAETVAALYKAIES